MLSDEQLDALAKQPNILILDTALHTIIAQAREANTLRESWERAEKERAALESAAMALQGAMKADDERLRAAAEKADRTPMGCDTADDLADAILGLRARIAELEGELAPLRLKAADRDDWQDACHKALRREEVLRAQLASARSPRAEAAMRLAGLVVNETAAEFCWIDRDGEKECPECRGDSVTGHFSAHDGTPCPRGIVFRAFRSAPAEPAKCPRCRGTGDDPSHGGRECYACGGTGDAKEKP